MPLPRLAAPELQEPFLLAFDHVQVTADTTIKLFKVPDGKSLRIDGVDYVNPTGLAADASNHFNLKILKGASTVMANWSTETGQQGEIAADTFVAMTLSATDANLVAAGADVISLFLDETGTQTLPAGRVVIRGRYV